jgi:hypothetical protein
MNILIEEMFRVIDRVETVSACSLAAIADSNAKPDIACFANERRCVLAFSSARTQHAPSTIADRYHGVIQRPVESDPVEHRIFGELFHLVQLHLATIDLSHSLPRTSLLPCLLRNWCARLLILCILK